MSKKIIGVIIAVVIILSAIIGVGMLASKDGLNNSSNKNSKSLGTSLSKDENTKKEESTNKNTESSKKILIVYFSKSGENHNVGNVEVGNTEIMAGYIKDYFGEKSDTFKIEPVNPYPSDYKKTTELANEELKSNARPEFKNASDLNLDDYDTIFIGYPIWWGEVPMIINSFLEKYDFSNKKIIPFNTHEGSGNAGTYTRIKSKMTSSDVNTNGLAIQGKTARQESSRSTVEKWLKELGY
ncbi:flavodoxin [Parvimonas micra]|uniref:flavodoxin n=1 Tax=Parvimonas micra TaxID=33033 RepID=UPI0028DC906E|nr:flavodoxin [Parvimonas micra]